MQEDRSISNIYAALELGPDGLAHLGDDGILRSYAADYTALSYVRLSPEQISADLARYPPDVQEQQGPIFQRCSIVLTVDPLQTRPKS